MDEQSAKGESADQNTSNQKFGANTDIPIKAYCETGEESHRRIERSHWKINSIVGIVTSFGVVITVALGIHSVILGNKTLREAQKATAETRRQANAAIEQNRRAFPAKLILVNVDLGSGPVKFKAGDAIKGRGFIINRGRERAILYDNDGTTKCFAYWHTGNLPMYRPHYDPQPSCGGKWNRINETQGSGEPGDILQFDFVTTVPVNYNQK